MPEALGSIAKTALLDTGAGSMENAVVANSASKNAMSVCFAG